MPNKPQGKSWSEIQLAITAISITATLGLWNLFSTPNKTVAAQVAPPDPTPTEPPAPTEAAQPTAAATALSLRPVKIIFGGKAPQQQVIQVAAAEPKKRKNNDGGGGGGGNPAPSNPNPQPSNPPNTGSSK